MTMEVLGEEIDSLVKGVDMSRMLRKRDKTRFLWKEDKMMQLANQLSRQAIVLGLLLKAIDKQERTHPLS